MSEEESVLLGAPLVVHEPAPGATAGSVLKAAREKQGLHIGALAVAMKVPVKKLEALEGDRLDLLPDAVFVRALASSVCRALKIEAAPVLQLLPVSAPPRLNADDRGINTPFNVPGQASGVSLKSLFTTPPALMVATLGLAAVGVYFYPETAKDMVVGEKLQSAASVVVPEVVPAPPVDSAANPVIPASAVAGHAPAAAPLVAMDSPEKVSVAPLPSAAAPASAPQAQPAIAPSSAAVAKAASAEAVNSSNVLQFKAKGTAWIQVTDAKGVQLLSRTLQAGETAGVSGTPPLAVVVGRVDLTSVEVRGKPYDLSTVAQNNVARFEVKP